jgi:hypothetical protein
MPACCARAVYGGHVAADPTIPVTKSRRRTVSPRRKTGQSLGVQRSPSEQEIATGGMGESFILRCGNPEPCISLWVKGGGLVASQPPPRG